MDYTSVIMMAIVQGVTESLPVSSSAHMILFSTLMSSEHTHLMQDVSVQTGTVFAFIYYFRHNILQMIRDWCMYGFTRQQTLYSRLAWCMVIGTVPVALAGLLFHPIVTAYLHSAWVIACAAIVFGVLMGAVDYYSRGTRALEAVGYKDALIIGLIQILALISGASRSGVTMTAARALHMTREDAARFSFMLSIPVSSLAVIFQAKEAIAADLPFDLIGFLAGMMISGVLAYVFIALFIRWVGRLGLMPFAIYRVILGSTIIVFILNGVIV